MGWFTPSGSDLSSSHQHETFHYAQCPRMTDRQGEEHSCRSERHGCPSRTFQKERLFNKYHVANLLHGSLCRTVVFAEAYAQFLGVCRPHRSFRETNTCPSCHVMSRHAGVFLKLTLRRLLSLQPACVIQKPRPLWIPKFVRRRCMSYSVSEAIRAS